MFPRQFPAALIILATLAAGATAQAPAPQPGRVTVTGTGEIRVAPDMAVITVEAAFTRGTPKAAAEEVRKAMGEVLRAARKAVRDTADLRTARVSLHPEYGWSEGKRIFQGYTASQSLEITLRELSRIEGLLDELFKSPVSGVAGPEFRHSKADSLRREALTLAVRDAAANAKVICAAAGRSCDGLLGTRMAGASAPGPFPAMETRMLAADAGGGMPVQSGVLAFAATVEADYGLE